RGSNTAQAAAAAQNAIAQPSQQHADLDARRAVVDVGFVGDKEAPVVAGGAVEQLGVLWPQQQVFQHGVVGQQDVGRSGAHGGAGDKFVGRRVVELFAPAESSQRLIRGFLRLAGVAAIGDGRVTPQQRAQAQQLVVSQRVHRVE